MNQLTVPDESKPETAAAAIATQVVNQLFASGAISRRPALSGILLEAFFRQYIESYAKPHCSSWRDMERSFKNYFKCFACLDMYQIKRPDVQKWHSEIGEANGYHAANRSLELMVMLYNKAQEWDLIMLYNPASRIRKFKLQPRERFLQPEELPRFFAALNTLRYETTRDLILMCLFTGARIGNVKAMNWNDVDLDLRTWRIPKTKNGDSQIIPLTMEAFSILERRKKRSKTKWVFGNDANTGHIKSVDVAWRRLVARAEIKDLRIHDLRRSLASWEAITGANTSVIAATLNHKSLSSTQIYARLNTAATKKAMKTATQAMLEHAGIFVQQEPAEVLQKLQPVQLASGQTDEHWLSEKEVSSETGIPPTKLAYWRSQNDGPAYLKQGYSVLYKLSSVRQWVAGRSEVLW